MAKAKYTVIILYFVTICKRFCKFYNFFAHFITFEMMNRAEREGFEVPHSRRIVVLSCE